MQMTHAVETRIQDRDETAVPVWVVAFFTVAVLMHNADHVRRGADTASTDVFWIGMSAIVLEVAVVVLALQRHHLAPIAAAAGGFGLALGYVVVHFLPARGWLSDSLASAPEVTWFSWVAAIIEVVAALALGAVGYGAWRRQEAAGGTSGQTLPLSTALTHPVAIAMVVGSAIIAAVSLGQL